MPVVCALLLVGPTAAAEAQSSVSRTNAVARTPIPAGVTLQTQDTQLTAADRNLLINVRLAGLWEIPAGKMAMTKGVSPRVRQIGQMIASQHVRLDAIDRAAAKKLGVALPDRPSGQQTRWLNEMAAAKGTAFDDLYVMRLRAAHGKIFPVIAVVRASTRNDDVRQVAQSSNNFVLTHISLLESTGLVRYPELPKAAAPPTQEVTAASTGRAASGNVAVPVIWLILATALIAGAVFTTRMVRPEIFGRRHTGPRRREQENPRGTRSAVRTADSYYAQPGLRLGDGARSRY